MFSFSGTARLKRSKILISKINEIVSDEIRKEYFEVKYKPVSLELPIWLLTELDTQIRQNFVF